MSDYLWLHFKEAGQTPEQSQTLNLDVFYSGQADLSTVSSLFFSVYSDDYELEFIEEQGLVYHDSIGWRKSYQLERSGNKDTFESKVNSVSVILQFSEDAQRVSLVHQWPDGDLRLRDFLRLEPVI